MPFGQDPVEQPPLPAPAPLTPAAGAPQTAAPTSGFGHDPVVGDAPAPLDTSSLSPAENIPAQFGAGLVTGLPNMAEGLLEAQERGRKMGMLPGMDVIAGMAEPLVTPAVNAAKRALGHPEWQSQSIEAQNHPVTDALSAVHLNPNEYFPEPKTPAERIARAGGEAGVQMLIPGMGLEGAADTLLGKAGMAASNLAVGTAGGAAGQALSEVVPDEAKPYASLFGNILGGGLALGVGKGFGKAAEGIKAAGDYLSPINQSKANIEKQARRAGWIDRLRP